MCSTEKWRRNRKKRKTVLLSLVAVLGKETGRVERGSCVLPVAYEMIFRICLRISTLSVRRPNGFSCICYGFSAPGPLISSSPATGSVQVTLIPGPYSAGAWLVWLLAHNLQVIKSAHCHRSLILQFPFCTLLDFSNAKCCCSKLPALLGGLCTTPTLCLYRNLILQIFNYLGGKFECIFFLEFIS